MSKDFKNYKAPEKTDKAWFYGGCLIMLIALLGWLENHDREHRAEIVAQQCSNTGA